MTDKIVKFHATWCAPCKMLSRIMQDMTLPVPVQEVDIDHNPALAQECKVRGVPTLVYFKQGQPVASLVGLRSEKEINDWVNAQQP